MQAFSKAVVSVNVLIISLSDSTNCNAKPSLACQAMWQCKSQDPGLSILKAIAKWPNPGSEAVVKYHRISLSYLDSNTRNASGCRISVDSCTG